MLDTVLARRSYLVNETDGWLTTAQVMVILGIGRTRLWQLAKDGRLTAHQHEVNRKQRYYRREEVERLAQAYRSVPTPLGTAAREGWEYARGDLLSGQ